jgi:hypothetical protein
MPSTTIKADQYIQLEYRVPRNGWIEFEIDANGPVTSYVLDKVGLNDFAEGITDFHYYGGFARRDYHQQKLYLPFNGSWFLVISNRSRTYDVRVRYEVSY